MMRMFQAAVVAGLVAGAATAQTVTVSLNSSQDAQTVAAGATIDWEISFDVSNGDNAGLALLIADLQQDGGNPETLDIPAAAAVPGAMTNFSRPDGISNPGEGGASTGYIGVQRGTAGSLNLVQIGGAQNNFGQALAAGTGVAENAAVVGGVGQSGTVILASGSFIAPGTDGDYTFSLANVNANVLTAVNAAPAVSPAAGASVSIANNSFTFTVGAAAPCPGDTDGDNDVDLTDLANILGNFGQAGAGLVGDLNNDGTVDLTDLAVVLAEFGQTC